MNLEIEVMTNIRRILLYAIYVDFCQREVLNSKRKTRIVKYKRDSATLLESDVPTIWALWHPLLVTKIDAHA